MGANDTADHRMKLLVGENVAEEQKCVVMLFISVDTVKNMGVVINVTG